MSLPAAPTLSQVRDEVFTRCGLNTGGDRGSRALKMIDSQIRRAHRELVVSAPWLRLMGTVTIDLVDGVSTYDFPDEMDPGKYAELYVRDVSSGKLYPLTPDPTQRQKNALSEATASRPFYFWFDDGQLSITPSPDPDFWDQISIRGYVRASDLVNPTDLISVDFEALVQRAELFVRPRIQMPVTEDMKTSHLAYVRQVRAEQSENSGSVAGGDTSQKCVPQDGPGLPRNGYAYDASWQPPGWYGE